MDLPIIFEYDGTEYVVEHSSDTSVVLLEDDRPVIEFHWPDDQEPSEASIKSMALIYAMQES